MDVASLFYSFAFLFMGIIAPRPAFQGLAPEGTFQVGKALRVGLFQFLVLDGVEVFIGPMEASCPRFRQRLFRLVAWILAVARRAGGSWDGCFDY